MTPHMTQKVLYTCNHCPEGAPMWRTQRDLLRHFDVVHARKSSPDSVIICDCKLEHKPCLAKDAEPRRASLRKKACELLSTPLRSTRSKKTTPGH